MTYYIYDIDLNLIAYGNENQIESYLNSGWIVSISLLDIIDYKNVKNL